MSTGFPEGKPLERVLANAYYNVGSLQFLRTTYKAAPDVALGFACLVGAACARLYSAARRGLCESSQTASAQVEPARARSRSRCGYGLPFFNGTAIDRGSTTRCPRTGGPRLANARPHHPCRQAHHDHAGPAVFLVSVGRDRCVDRPGLTKRPVLVRQATLYADPRSSQLQTAVDDLVQQARLVPGQLRPLLDLMAVGQLVVPTDGIRGQSGEPDPATAARALNSDFPPGSATATFGGSHSYVPVAGRGGSPVTLPEIRSYRIPGGPGIVRVQPTAGATVMDGDAEGITELAAVHGLDTSRPLFYAGDLKPPALRDQVRQGATLVFTDSNRRRFVAGSLTTQNKSATLGPTDPIPPSLPTFNLFPALGSSDQTVALYSGLNYLRTPLFQGLGLTPEYRPYAAFDGHLATAWVATLPDTHLRYVQLALNRPRAISSIRVHAHADVPGGTARPGSVGQRRTRDALPAQLRLDHAPLEQPRRPDVAAADRRGGAGGWLGWVGRGPDTGPSPARDVAHFQRARTRRPVGWTSRTIRSRWFSNGPPPTSRTAPAPRWRRRRQVIPTTRSIPSRASSGT